MKKYTHTNELPYTLSVEELAAFLGISRVGAYNLAHAKGFPTLRVSLGTQEASLGCPHPESPGPGQ